MASTDETDVRPYSRNNASTRVVKSRLDTVIDATNQIIEMVRMILTLS